MIRRARTLIKEQYDNVYCVLDYDAIVSDRSELRKFESEVNKLKNKKSTDKINIILSMPYIEYWFLLHFKNKVSGKEYLSFDELKPDLLQHIPDYEKTERYFRKCDFYNMISKEDREEHAICLAKILAKQRQQSDSLTFPFTDVFKLIEELENMSRSSRNR